MWAGWWGGVVGVMLSLLAAVVFWHRGRLSGKMEGRRGAREVANSGVVHTYHERQTVLKCGVHAVNNLLGERVFCSADFDAFSRSVSPESMWTRLGVGNYDVNVLEVALKSRGLVVSWFDRRKTFAEADATHCQGLMLNRLSDAWLSSVVGMRHWVSVRRHEEQWYNCDSMLKEAELLSGTQLEELVREALEQHDGYCLLITKETLR